MDQTDLEQWVDIFDKALTSRDPIVKEQLSKLLMIAALATSDSSAAERGPFRSMLEEMADMRCEIRNIQSNINRNDQYRSQFADQQDYMSKYTSMARQDMMKKMAMPSINISEFWSTAEEKHKIIDSLKKSGNNGNIK